MHSGAAVNTPGTRISGRLAQLAVAFLIVVGFVALSWPHMWSSKPSIPNIPVTKFSEPQHVVMPQPIAPPSIKALAPMVVPHPTPQARPTPCQACIAAANEVLMRYLHAIRDGAGADNREERNVYEAPKVYPNPAPPVFVPGALSYDESHP
jgi:hypothetical protein